jgi:hypothetical protein
MDQAAREAIVGLSDEEVLRACPALDRRGTSHDPQEELESLKNLVRA